MGALDGKRVAVIGGAGSLADAAVTAFESEGASVVRVEPDAGGDATDAVERAITALGGLDVLANLTAPAGPALPSAEVGRDEWERVFKATVRTARTSNQAAFRHMSASGGGLVINCADASAEFGVPGQAMASAAAQAVVALSTSSAGAWAGSGVRINVIQPGLMSDVATSVVPTLVFMVSAAPGLHGKTLTC